MHESLEVKQSLVKDKFGACGPELVYTGGSLRVRLKLPPPIFRKSAVARSLSIERYSVATKEVL